jgi:hypothetical protein
MSDPVLSPGAHIPGGALLPEAAARGYSLYRFRFDRSDRSREDASPRAIDMWPNPVGRDGCQASLMLKHENSVITQ